MSTPQALVRGDGADRYKVKSSQYPGNTKSLVYTGVSMGQRLAALSCRLPAALLLDPDTHPLVHIALLLYMVQGCKQSQ